MVTLQDIGFKPPESQPLTGTQGSTFQDGVPGQTITKTGIPPWSVVRLWCVHAQVLHPDSLLLLFCCTLSVILYGLHYRLTLLLCRLRLTVAGMRVKAACYRQRSSGLLSREQPASLTPTDSLGEVQQVRGIPIGLESRRCKCFECCSREMFEMLD